MSIRAEFQPVVDEFIDDLHQFATGSYLQEGETELWEQPFDPQALPELRRILEKSLDALEVLPADPSSDALSAVVAQCYTELSRFNARYDGAVLEPEEHSTLSNLFYDAAAATGATEETLQELPDLDL